MKYKENVSFRSVKFDEKDWSYTVTEVCNMAYEPGDIVSMEYGPVEMGEGDSIRMGYVGDNGEIGLIHRVRNKKEGEL